ncbi:unnamed protein product [Blepharisma stoltei]|uniref:C2 domain-containing protein n=1 Tax=Blepharisma stoltei TaxID=1481888 RepID=A0AAU9IT83_9CILI|nr:unnamed protein product [Blepharisma stoltei]
MLENPGNPEPLENADQNEPQDTSPLLNRRDLPSLLPPPLVELVRPDIKWPLDHYLEEIKYIKPVETSGFLGTDLLGLNKPAIVRGEANTVIGQIGSINLDSKVDGIYVRTLDKLTSNLQRYEQRLLRLKELSFFNRSNWQLRIDSDLTTHSITRPIDISLEHNPAVEIKHLSAVLSHRNNVRKNKYYRLDLHIGTLQFKDHPLFSQEDILASQLQEMFYDYEKRVTLCLVDHLQDRLDSLQGQLAHKEEMLRVYMQAPSTTQQEKNKLMLQEVEILKKHFEDAQKKLNDEKAAIQKEAEALYNKWVELKQLREKQTFVSTSVKLGVREYNDIGQGLEYDFFLQPQEPSADTTLLGVRLPSQEITRRRAAQSFRVFVRIYVNGIYAARSTKKFMKWPQFQVPFLERFQLHLFSRPVKIRLEVCTGFTIVRVLGVIEFNPPGLNVSALTSTAKVYKNLDFISGRVLPNKIDGTPRKVQGNITIKAYWEGQSDKMPPFRFEDLAALPKKSIASKGELDYYIDVNDPRNKDLVEDLRQKRNRAIQEMLRLDSLFPHHRFSALREIFMKERYRNVELCGYPIPLLERDIRNTEVFMRFLNSLKDIKDDYNRMTYFFLQQYKLRYSQDPPTKRRIIELMEYFMEKQNQVKLGIQKNLHSLPSIVREFVFIEINPFGQCWKLLFTPRRKLLPRRNAVQTVSGASVGMCKINIIIYKGVNIPVRDEAWSKRYAQVERFYQPIPPAYKSAMGEPLPPNNTYMSQFPQYRTGSSYQNQGYNSGYPPSPNRMSPRNSMYPPGGRSSGFDPYQSQYGRPPSPGGYGRPPSPPGGYGRPPSPGYNGPPPPQYDAGPYIPPRQGQGYEAIERVQSFVEVRLFHQGESTIVRTAPFDGTNPEWNELLELTFQSLDKVRFSKEELMDCDSVLYFNLYDQLLNIKQVIMDKGEVNLRLERRYLGSFALPLLTVFQNPSGIEASFRVDRPLCLFGYHTSKENPFIPFHHQGIEHPPPFLNPGLPTYIMLKVTLDPVLELPTESEADYYPGFENPKFLFHGFQWMIHQKNKQLLKNRNIVLWAENTKNQSVFLPRFITPLQPPPGLLSPNDPDPIAKVVRFVSLIPHIEDNKAFKDLPDLWSTCQEFLDLGFGDYEEHAILLCNYFKWIDKDNPSIKTYIVIGRGVPEGKTVYVLRRDINTHDVELWCSSTGIGFSLKQEGYASRFLCWNITRGTRTMSQDVENIIGLKSVGCLVDENDVYINIQPTSDPYSIDYDVDNPKTWLAFLGNGTKRTYYFPNNVVSTIQEPISYEITPQRFVQDIQVEIEDIIRTKFQDARASGRYRRPLRTSWNRDVAQRLYEILWLFEAYKSDFRDGAQQSSLYNFSSEASINKLAEIQDKVVNLLGDSTYAYGFPINLPLTDIDSIWEEVLNTDLYNIADDDCEFVLCVRVFEYPCFISSVWVYIAALFGGRGGGQFSRYGGY